MRLLALCAALIAFASAAAALDPDAQEALRQGEMVRFNFAQPTPAPETAFTLPEGGEYRLSDFRGAPVLVNFWATWCPPCLKEMPSLDRLQEKLGGEAHIVTIAAGRNAPAAIDRFFEKASVTGLPKYMDPKGTLAREMAALGLPVSILLDAEGQVVGRLVGDAVWDSPEAEALIRAFIPAN